MKLSRTLEQWAGCDPRAMTQQSPAALEFAFQDAKHDIRALAAATAALQARALELETVLRNLLARYEFDGIPNDSLPAVEAARSALAKGLQP